MTRPLIDVAELSRRLGEVRLFDLRWSLTDPEHGVRAYEAGHIPGAVFVDLETDLSGTHGDGRHPLPALSDFEKALGRLGLTSDDQAVIYDDVGAAIAARMWWMLRAIGHPAASVLDGGLQAWQRARLPLAEGREEPAPVVYQAAHDFIGWVGHQELDGRVVVDVRAEERYTGETEPVDPKAGHIPGAINLPTTGNLRAEGLFLDAEDLADRFRHITDRPVLSCGSGVNACHTALAMILADRGMPDIYVGSFSDWSRRDLPVHTGPEP